MAEFFASAFWTSFLWPLIIMVAESVLLLVVLLIAIAYILLADRKIWAAVQIRRGPNVVGPWGLLQSFADLLKFVLKEPIIPSGANKGVFLLAPLVSCILALAAWAVIPMDWGWVISDINVGILYIFAISSLSIYGIIMAGWSSNSKYPFLAALRSAAQMVSYEVSMGFVIVTVLLCVGSLNLSDIVRAQQGLWFATEPWQAAQLLMNRRSPIASACGSPAICSAGIAAYLPTTASIAFCAAACSASYCDLLLQPSEPAELPRPG